MFRVVFFVIFFVSLSMFAKVKSQECGEQWNEFVIKDDSNNAIFQLDKGFVSEIEEFYTH
jgi:hypothetical protein